MPLACAVAVLSHNGFARFVARLIAASAVQHGAAAAAVQVVRQAASTGALSAAESTPPQQPIERRGRQHAVTPEPAVVAGVHIDVLQDNRCTCVPLRRSCNARRDAQECSVALVTASGHGILLSSSQELAEAVPLRRAATRWRPHIGDTPRPRTPGEPRWPAHCEPCWQIARALCWRPSGTAIGGGWISLQCSPRDAVARQGARMRERITCMQRPDCSSATSGARASAGSCTSVRGRCFSCHS